MNTELLEEMKKRSDFLKSSRFRKKSIYSFVELKFDRKQIESISQAMWGLTVDEQYEYLRGKVHGNICLENSVFTTREDQPDFQYIFDIGIKAIQLGVRLKEDTIDQADSVFGLVRSSWFITRKRMIELGVNPDKKGEFLTYNEMEILSTELDVTMAEFVDAL